jgi:hypothetical protein
LGGRRDRRIGYFLVDFIKRLGGILAEKSQFSWVGSLGYLLVQNMLVGWKLCWYDLS